jgi:hypothetical protein
MFAKLKIVDLFVTYIGIITSIVQIALSASSPFVYYDVKKIWVMKMALGIWASIS